MGGVRKKKSRRQATIKITKNARKKKKQIRPALGDAVLKKHWDNSKTLQQNLKHLGIAYDPNEVIKILKNKRITRKDLLRADAEGVKEMEVEKDVPITAVIEEFEKRAANGKETERHIAPGEAKFLFELMKKHGKNYKNMFKDKRNTHQHTIAQLRRKCEGLLKSSLLQKYREMFPDIAPVEKMETV